MVGLIELVTGVVVTGTEVVGLTELVTGTQVVMYCGRDKH